MTTDAIIRFETLRCIGQRDASGGSEPYFWSALVFMDRQTLATPERVGFVAPSSGNARVVVRQDMRKGQQAPVPVQVGTLRVRLEDFQRNVRVLLPIVALWENDETPAHVVRAAHEAWVATLRSEMVAVFQQVFMAGAGGLDLLPTLLPPALKRTFEAAGRAIRDELTGFESFEIWIGSLNLDDFVGVASHAWRAEGSENFTLTLRKDGDPDHYELLCSATLKPVVADPCQPLVDRVRDAERLVADIQAQISELQDQLNGQGDPDGGSLPKAFLIAEIRRLRDEELGPAMAALDEARQALEACRRRRVPKDRLAEVQQDFELQR